MESTDIRSLRLRFGLTQTQVAERAGVKQPEVSAVESGGRQTPEARERVLAAIRALARPRDVLTPEVREHALEVFARYGATDVRLFGSVARQTDRPGSDIDFIAKFPDGFSLFAMVALEEALEEVIGLPVDVVSDDPRESGRVLTAINASAVPLNA